MGGRMDAGGDGWAGAEALKRQAVEALGARAPEPAAPQDLGPQGVARLVHDLRVHQVELELQNDELRRIQAQLESARACYRDLYDQAPVGYCTVSWQGLILEANLTAATLLGVERSQLLEQPLNRYIQPQDQDRHYLHRRQPRGLGEQRSCEVGMLKAGGTPFTALLVDSLAQDSGGGFVHRVVLTDISEHRRAEADKERLLKAVEQVGDSIVITDPLGTIVYVNPAFLRVTGYGLAEALGRNPRILKGGHSAPEFYAGLWKTIAGGSTWTGRMENRRKDGSLFAEEATISPVRGPGGAIINYVAVKRDITDQLRREAQLTQAQKMESVGRLAGGVAHDFNNMLSVILIHTEQEMEGLDAGLPLYASLQAVHQAATRSADLTHQLLAFARQQVVAPRPLDLNAAVGAMVKLLGRLLGPAIAVEWSPQPGLWPLRMDPSQVDQILMNLCLNARDAFSGKGIVSLATANAALDGPFALTHLGAAAGDYVVLTVHDNGSGMDAETLRQVFEPFFTTKALGQGTGLGLATVYGIVKQNHGFIDAQSEPGQGTTFTVYLPRHAEGPL